MSKPRAAAVLWEAIYLLSDVQPVLDRGVSAAVIAGIGAAAAEARLTFAEATLGEAVAAVQIARRLSDACPEPDVGCLLLLPSDLPRLGRGLALWRHARTALPRAREAAEHLEAECRSALVTLDTQHLAPWYDEDVSRRPKGSKLDRTVRRMEYRPVNGA